MGIENITARILEEAREEAGNTQRAAEEERDRLLKEAEAQAEAQREELQKKAEEDAVLLKERKASVAELEVRKLKLAVKQEMIEESFQEALKALIELDDSQYVALLERELAAFREEGGEVLLNASDKSRLGETLEKWMAGSRLTVAQDTADIKGGFLIRRGKIYINGSLEEILEGEKKEMTAHLASLLFA